MTSSARPASWPTAGSADRRSPHSRNRRALVIGNAGSGKTTLLQWLAVRSALGDFRSSLAEWNDAVPFFIPRAGSLR